MFVAPLVAEFCKKIAAEVDVGCAGKTAAEMDVGFAEKTAAGVDVRGFAGKTAAEVDMRFAEGTLAEGVVLEAAGVDGVDIHMGMALTEQDITVPLRLLWWGLKLDVVELLLMKGMIGVVCMIDDKGREERRERP